MTDLLLVEVVSEVEAGLPLGVGGVLDGLCPADLGPVSSYAGLEERVRLGLVMSGLTLL